MKYKEVQRPKSKSSGSGAKRKPDSLAGQLRTTAETGKAIVVSRMERAAYIHGALKRQGYILHTLTDGENLICWCEKIAKDGGGDESSK